MASQVLRDEPEEVRRQVEALVAHLETGDDPALDRGVLAIAPGLADGLGASADLPGLGVAAVGDRVGPYRLLEPLGHGGMGVVFLAERADHEFEQRVAVKLLSAPASSAAERARFLRERQFLAHLEHPSIARLLDGGVTERGVPYLVLEAVDGLPIDRHCDQNGASIERRLRLFLDVCDAVEHAHRRLIVHRDLKPANILVTTTHDGREAVKLLDFGIAHLVELDDDATRTLLHAFTPDYASPEQLRRERAGIPSDVYSLGVLLYRLLAGRLPHDTRHRRPSEVELLVCTVDPPPPSRARLGELPPRASARSDRQLARRLRGDLDNIVLRAMAKEPEQRYASVGDLARDLRRHLDGRPVEARAPTAGYRLRKFVRRHRLLVAAAVAVVGALALGLALAAIQAARATRERDVARREAAKAASVASFLAELFGAADPYAVERAEPTVRELLARGEERIGRELVPYPEVRADLLATMGRAYRGLGDYQAAERLTREALDLHRDAGHADPLAFGRALHDHANVRSALGDRDDAARHLDQAIEVLEDSGHAHSADMAGALISRARLESHYDDDLAERLYLKALDILERNEVSGSTPAILHELGGIYEARGDLEASLRLKTESLRMAAELHGPNHPSVHLMQGNLAVLHKLRGDLEEAERLARASIAGLEARLGAEHPDLASGLNNLGNLLLDQGRVQEAAPLVERAVRLGSIRPDDTYETVAYRVNLGTLRREQGRAQEALALYQEAGAFFRERLGAGHPAVARIDSLSAQALRLLDRGAEAEALLRGALALQETALHADHPDLAESRAALGGLLCERGDPESGLPQVLDGCAGSSLRPQEGPLRRAACSLELGLCRAAASEIRLAGRQLEEAAPLLAGALPAEHYLQERAQRLAVAIELARPARGVGPEGDG
ncbi:MAG TPA: serine/threonine-protein kinase [Thermoanaerobaculia bacterium]|nr:serine/threonine-protein kinase [Thermoanaerobaculia bacterium]